MKKSKVTSNVTTVEETATVAEGEVPPALAAALRVIEAVWTPGTAPASVQAVLGRFAEWHRTAGGAEPLAALTTAIDRDGVEPFAISVFRSRQKILTGGGGVLKAEAVYQIAQLLREHGAETEEDVSRLSGNSDFEDAARKIPGIGEGTLRRLYALCSGGAGTPTPTDVPPPRTPAVPRPPSPKFEPLPAPVVVPDEEPTIETPAAEVTAPPAEPPTKKPRRKKSEKAKKADATNSDAQDDASPAPADSYHVRMREVPLDERPRERLIQYGAETVSVEELLAILLRTGTEKMNAVDLAHHLLTRHGGMRGLSGLTVEEMSKIHGIGPAKACQIKAAIEFGRRLVALSPEERPKIRSPRDVYNLLGPSLRDEKREHLIAVLLDTKNGIIRQKTVSIGDLSSSLVHPREVFLEAIRHSSASLIVAHNHPSGDPSPSPEDVAVTRRLSEAGTLLGIELLDHIVLGDGRWVSLKEKGLM